MTAFYLRAAPRVSFVGVFGASGDVEIDLVHDIVQTANIALSGTVSVTGNIQISDGSGADLTWSAVSGATGYRIYHGTSSGVYSQARGSGIDVGNVTTYPISSLSLSADVTYFVTMAAYDSDGEGALFNEIQVLDGVKVS